MISLEPIGHVRSPRTDLSDDNWGNVTASIELCDSFDPSCLDGLTEFSHAEIIYHFDRVAESAINRSARHPRGNTAWPKVGIFAQRGKDRPNRIGTTMVEIISREGHRLTVRGLDAIDGTPVLDIKPVMAEFLPRTPVRQPGWSRELMRDYWNT
jgi:tRNA-Thr(GGU) m(6)t(6)A37 methyltransferase TsaA